MTNPGLHKIPNLCFLLVVFFLYSCNNRAQKPAMGQNANKSTKQLQTTKHEVIIAAMKFQPDTLVINKGDTVLFTNNDVVAHDVTDFPDKEWASPPLQPGDTWIYIPTGNAIYFCSIHQVMKGKIIVK